MIFKGTTGASGLASGLAYAFAAAWTALMPGAALAQGEAAATPKPRAVIELFTSQGCSSCPAADALFVELARDPGLLVLTLPVDYWDYLGWKDTLAHSAFSQRQRGYAKTRGDGQLYTPQAVINGASHTVGSDRGAIEQIVAGQRATALPLDVAIKETASQVQISVSGSARAGSIWVLPIARSRSVSIQRGENRGRDIVYANVVRGLMRVGDWRGAAMTLELPLTLVKTPEADSYAVIVHSEDGKVGRIIGAARGPRF